MPKIIAVRRRRTNVRIPVYTVEVSDHPILYHTFAWPPPSYSSHQSDDDTFTLTESGRELAREIIARRQQEEDNA